ncbi:methyltransferase domain-containing protein [Rossellomorea marisflavi]|uniref:methyltransferase domain-containing protein n=1 Tax=Rossellomorea marisflavi TaxID=189381 RepID=UPI00345A7317
MNEWNASQYLMFGDERTQPSIDLIGRVDHVDPRRVLDIGCGPGNGTERLHLRYADADVYGIDSSIAMIEAAREAYPRLRFDLCDASKDLPSLDDGYDIVFSNAVIQWIPDHGKLLGEMFQLLNDGGTLAVQMPINEESPAFRVINEVIRDPKWGFTEKEFSQTNKLSTGEYVDILSGLTDEFSVWETIYYHRMKEYEEILEWVKGTKLLPFLKALEADEAKKQAFQREILEGIKGKYSRQVNGEIMFRFKRLFFTAKK